MKRKRSDKNIKYNTVSITNKITIVKESKNAIKSYTLFPAIKKN